MSFDWLFDPAFNPELSGVATFTEEPQPVFDGGSLVQDSAQSIAAGGLDFLEQLALGPGGTAPSIAQNAFLDIDPGAPTGDLFGPAALPGRGITHPVGKELFFNPASGEVVNAAGQRIIDAETLRLTADLISGAAPADPTIMQRITAGLKTADAFLGTTTGRTLAMLGLGAVGLGIGRAVAGSGQPFQPTSSGTTLADNPAAIALQQEIQMNAMEQLRRAGINPGGTAGELDPITAMLTERLKKAFSGEVSNPVLERANKQEQERLANEIFQKWGRFGDDSSPAIEKKVLLDESQAIRAYLDNQNTINTLAPMQGNRITSNLGFQASLAGLDRLGSQQQAQNDLNDRLAFQAWQTENADRQNTARSIASLFGLVADSAIGRADSALGRQPQNRDVLGGVK